MTGIGVGCACAACGHATARPPRSALSLRRRCFEVNPQLELRRLQHWQVCGLISLKNPRGVDTALTIGIGNIDAVTQQSARHSIFAELIDRGQSLSFREGT